eukprot:1115415-Karenia_brevis.AAC.1
MNDSKNKYSLKSQHKAMHLRRRQRHAEVQTSSSSQVAAQPARRVTGKQPVPSIAFKSSAVAADVEVGAGQGTCSTT